jgi:Flp pilus assembly protein TadG
LPDSTPLFLEPEGALGMKICRQDRRSAAATVELAVLLPFLMFLIVIGVDYGRIVYYSVTVENCARNGALYAGDPVAASQSPYASLQDAALADAGDLSPPPTVTSTNGVDAAGNPYVDVTVSWTFQTITTYPGVPSQTTLTRTVRAQVAPNLPN